jgi:ribosomal protein L15
LGNDGKAMNNETIFYAFCYELALWLMQRFPKLRFNPWLELLVDYCRPFWTEWKTQLTLKAVDEQVDQLKEQWEKEEREYRAEVLAQKAQELFPDATVMPLPDAIVPSVMIVREAAPDASDAVKALGGELRITYQLKEDGSS